jgi:hypothetical protein
MTARPAADGALHLTIPVREAGTVFDVAMIVTPRPGAPDTASSEDSGWPEGYFEQTYGSISDESFVAPPRLPPKQASPTLEPPRV